MQQDYNHLYMQQKEPWNYSKRAVEVLRHEFLSDKANSFYVLKNQKLAILDIGCSLGQMTKMLSPYGDFIVGMDISVVAASKARAHCQGTGNPFYFLSASSAELPFADRSFDFVIASDGITEWFDTCEQLKKKTVAEIHRVLKPNGMAVFTDYIHPDFFSDFIALVLSAEFSSSQVEFLYDRLWYRMESLLKTFSSYVWVQSLLANVGIARRLKTVGRTLGKKYSKHICVSVKK